MGIKAVQLSIEFERERAEGLRLPDFIGKLQNEFLDEEYPGAEVTKNMIIDKKRKKKSSY